MHDQASKLRELKRHASRHTQRARKTQCVSVIGTKGGVGTTTVAAYLAMALAKASDQVGLATGATRAIDLATITGLSQLAELDSGSETDHRSNKEPFVWGDSVSVFAPGTVHRAAFAETTKRLDYMVTDCGCWQGKPEPLIGSTVAFLVTTEDTLAMMDTYACIKQLREAEGETLEQRLCVVLNQASEFASESVERLQLTCQRFLGLQIRNPLLVPMSDDLPVEADWQSPDGLVVDSLVSYLKEGNRAHTTIDKAMAAA